MQAGGGPQKGSGHGRSTSASASAFAALERQRQQPLQQQIPRRGETNDTLLVYQAANTGQANSGSMQLPQQVRRLDDLGQHHGARNVPDQNNNGSQVSAPQMLNPIQQEYFPCTFRMGSEMLSPLSEDQDLWTVNMNMQELISAQSANQSQAAHGERHSENSQRPVSDNKSKPNSGHSSLPGQAMPSISIMGRQLQQNIKNTTIGPTSMAAQMQAMQASALERNIDLVDPANADVIAQLVPVKQSGIVAQQENSSGVQQSASITKQLGSLPQVGHESSPRDKSSSDVPRPFGSSKAWQANSSSILSTLLGKRWLPMNPAQSSRDFNQGVEKILYPKAAGSAFEFSRGQNAKFNQSPRQSAAPSNDRDGGNPSASQGGSRPRMRQSNIGFTKQQTHVLKAQILVFTRLEKKKPVPRVLLQSITPPPLDVQMQQIFPCPATVSRDRFSEENTDVHIKQSNENGVQVVKPVGGTENSKEGGLGNDKAAALINTTTSVNNKLAQPSNMNNPKDASSGRKYHGPLFDFPVFARKLGTLGSSMMNGNSNLVLDIPDLLTDEGGQFRKRRREEKIDKIDKILATNVERKRIRPDLVLRLQIEYKKLKLVEQQARLRDEIVQQQMEIMKMPDRPYRRFVRLCERQREDLKRESQANQKATQEKKLKSIFLWRKKLLEGHWAMRDARTARNRGVLKHYERMFRELSKKKDDDRTKRMEALKNNDVERYREMLLEQQNNVPEEAAERYAVLSSFLTQTEEYLHKLGGKITATKNQQKVEEAANAAAAAARSQGLSEEEVRAAAACAREEMMVRNHFSEMNAPQDSSSVNKYYNLAHAVNERVIKQPSMLRAGILRDYQLVGLQWMLSLYNNKLNGILADEMGLGKTVQVMALIAYLMEVKGNNGPHLIIVPNAVLVNWKSELHNWLPTLSCIYYVGSKDQRSKLFSQEVLSLKFNVLVTTYEFIMNDRSRLSKIDWKYVIIDEAQRMKDRESVLARDLDRYRCQRRLLLTGTPLQNDLKELWSLLNLLLPEVFDNRKTFNDWFSQPFQKEGPTHNAEDDWLETEKKVIIIHRLHQILEPFMLRRRVEDVEGSLPPKVSIILKCRMSAIQSAIYDWIKATGTIRVDPAEENRKAERNPNYQPQAYKTLSNKCMELRKACNHPLLNYPFFSDLSKDFMVRSCGKLWILDRILIKLQKTGHRVLLFSTMTKLLDIVEEYLQWRGLVFRRIDGTTSLEDRESAIVDFNNPRTDCFIFLLSIRAAGRGLNLQTADTVIIYDPDPNPKNEEQAVARAHRIGQTREVKVIYMEAVVDKISSHEKEDKFISGGAIGSDDDLAGKDQYMGSIESLIRNNIQQYKIDMADEVINAGRFDQRTTHEERRMTLETLLHDEERYQETVHDVPSLHEVNRMIARSEEEIELFDMMDEEYKWEEEMFRYDEVPDWLRAGTKDVDIAVANLSKKRSNKALFGGNIGLASGEGERGRRKKKIPVYAKLDDDEEFSQVGLEDGNVCSGGEEEDEEGEIGEFQDDVLAGEPEFGEEQSEEDRLASDDGSEYQRAPRSIRKNNKKMPKEAVSSGSSSPSRRLTRMVLPSVSSQKFGSLSALDGRSKKQSKKSSHELAEEEIEISGDSQMGEDDHVLQPKIKRKRSIRPRPQNNAEKLDDKPSDKGSLRKSEEKFGEKVIEHRGDSSQLKPFKVDHKKSKTREDMSRRVLANSSLVQAEKNEFSSIKSKRNLPRKSSNASDVHQSIKYGRSFGSAAPQQLESKMSEVVQRKCKNVISKIQRRINGEGQQIVPLLTELWKRTENSSGEGDGPLDLGNILVRIDKLEYSGVMEIVSDVQRMLKSGMQHYGFTYEVRSEARKVYELFFETMDLAFSDVDFTEAKSSMSFSNPAAATPGMGSSSKQTILSAHKKRPKLPEDSDSDNSPFQKPQARVPFRTMEDTATKARRLMQKESRPGSSSRILEPSQSDDARTPYTHPRELVICKKNRKDGEKTSVKPGSTLSSSPLSPPTGLGRNLGSPGSCSGSKESSSGQQQSRAGISPVEGRSGGGGGSLVSWSNPVKRIRSDASRRRPSHL